MLTWTFKNKLKSLDDIELLDYLKNKDNFPHRLIMLIEQEARKRFFSNKEFNGQDDEYVHPLLQSRRKTQKRRFIRKTSLSFVLTIVFFAIIFYLPAHFFVGFGNVEITQQFARWLNQPSENQPASESTTVYFESEKKKTNDSSQVAESREPAQEKVESEKTVAEKQPIAAVNNKLDGGEGKLVDFQEKPVQETTLPDEPTTIAKQEEKILQLTLSELLKPEEKKPERDTQIEVQPDPVIEKPIVSKTENPIKPIEVKEIKPLEVAVDDKKTENQIQPKNTDVATNDEDISNVHMLSTPMLRLFIPFLNDWAFKQTQQVEITDYFVENNSIVSFKISKKHSDAIGNFKEAKTQSMMNNYWSNLEKELGSDFPRIPITIRFLRFDEDL